ncbi:MAG: hypothetical protein ACRBBW_20610 [Cellvibrionaceae bacterium]
MGITRPTIVAKFKDSVVATAAEKRGVSVSLGSDLALVASLSGGVTAAAAIANSARDIATEKAAEATTAVAATLGSVTQFDETYAGFLSRISIFDTDLADFDASFAIFENEKGSVSTSKEAFDIAYSDFLSQKNAFDTDYMDFTDNYSGFSTGYGNYITTLAAFSASYDSFVIEKDDFDAKFSTISSLHSDVVEKAAEVASDVVASSNSSQVAQDAALFAGMSATEAEGYKNAAQSAAGSVTNGLYHVGEWDASTGIAPPTPTHGCPSYKISAAGVVEGVDYGVGDTINWDTVGWYKIDNTESVTSIDGMQGVVDLSGRYVPLASVKTPVPLNAIFTDTTYSVGDGGLSEYNFTATLKNKYDNAHSWGDHALAGYAVSGDLLTAVPLGAKFTDTIYSHPQSDVSDPILSGARVLASLETNSAGHVTAMTSRDLTPSDIGALARDGGTLTSVRESVNVENASGVVNLSAGNVHSMTLNTSRTISFSGLPAAGVSLSATLIIAGGDAHAVTWPASIKWGGGSAPTLTAKDVIVLHTIDGGVVWFGHYAGSVA